MKIKLPIHPEVFEPLPDFAELLVRVLFNQPTALLNVYGMRRVSARPEAAPEQIALSKALVGLAELRILAMGGNQFAYSMLQAVACAAISELQACGIAQPDFEAQAVKQSLTWPTNFSLRTCDIDEKKRQFEALKLGTEAAKTGAQIDNFYDVVAETLLAKIWLERAWPIPSTDKLPDGTLVSLACKKLPLLRVPDSAECWWNLGRLILREVVADLVGFDFPAIVALKHSGRSVESTLVDKVHQAFKSRFPIWRRREDDGSTPW